MDKIIHRNKKKKVPGVQVINGQMNGSLRKQADSAARRWSEHDWRDSEERGELTDWLGD